MQGAYSSCRVTHFQKKKKKKKKTERIAGEIFHAFVHNSPVFSLNRLIEAFGNDMLEILKIKKVSSFTGTITVYRPPNHSNSFRVLSNSRVGQNPTLNILLS